MNFKEIEALTVKKCGICKGESFLIKHVNNQYILEDCKCVDELKRDLKYDVAKISQEWWKFGIDDLEKDFPKNIIDDIKYFQDNVRNCVLNKVQFYFWGRNGNGKNLLSILMLKSLIDKGYKGIFMSSFEILNYLYTGNTDNLMVYDFIVLDEVDKVMSNKITDTCNVIIHLLEYKSLVLLSNTSPSDLSIKLRYPQNFIERIKNVKEIKFPDKDYRGKFQNKFDALKGMKNV